jgi:TolB protein
VLEGSAGSERICGLGGNDTLEGLGGNDELVGGPGDDTLDGGPGTDAAHFTAAPMGVTASLVTNQATGDGFDLMVGIENLIGSNYDDTLIGSSSRNNLSGRSGVDQLFGLERADRLVGGAQDDALRGGPGDDRVVANGGSDDLFGEDGADSLDSKDGVEGNDALDGGTGTDACSTDPIEESIANCEKQLNIPPTPDTTPPITTSTLSSQPNAAGWNNSNVTVTLNATDDDSGVKQISFSINGGAHQTYNPKNKITVSSEGVSTISYFATDNAGNQESPAKTFTVKLDKSAPALDTVTPDNRQTGVSRTIEPTATFSDEMDPTSLITSIKLYRWNALEKAWQRVPATVSVVDEMATLDPYGATEQLLAANKKYKVTVTTGARNLAHIAMSSPKSWTFTTEGASGEATNVPAEGTSGEAANGRIAFSHGEVVSSIFAVNADGTGQTNLTQDTNASFNSGPAWSPDGTKIAFSSNMDSSGSELRPEEIYVMDADGTNVRRLTDNHTTDTGPAWSPDGTKIAYSSYGETGFEVSIINADGSDEVRLTNSPESVEDIDSSGNLTRFRDNFDPVWLPDGEKIAFRVDSRPSGDGIYTMNPDGSNQTLLTADGDQADWSPDGTKMVYRGSDPGQSYSDIYIANADGSNPVNITARISDTAYELLPDWSPDSTKIAFASNLDEKAGYEIYVIDVDGRNLRRLTNAPGMDLYPDWQPLP